MNSRVSIVRGIACLLFVTLTSFPVQNPVWGQAGLREALERLDRDGDGEVEPEEITPLARPYLERITRASRMSISRDNDIEELQEAARRYYAQENGSSDRKVRPEGESTVKQFGTDPDQPLVPEFGLSEVKFPYTQDDLDFADRTMRSHDRNRDGYIDRAEAARERWTHRNPFDDDLNGDERLSRLEMAQRYARRRLLDNAGDQLRQKAWRTGGEIRPVERRDDDRRRDTSWWRRGNSHWLSGSVLERFDENKNGRLEAHECKELGMPIALIDLDLDGELSRDEIQNYLTPMQEQAGQLSEGIPGWFFERDEDRDRQVSISEYAIERTQAEMDEFATLDLNSDGFLTTAEVVRSKTMMGGSFTNANAELLPPGKTVISEIEVPDHLVIGDLNLKLSITHTNTGHLDAFLTGPDGQRIELFTEIGGRENNFDETIFDDESEYPISKARPPYQGRFSPEAVIKRQPSLSYFRGKSAKGVWQLVIRGTRSDRFGMLHNWSLMIRPEEQQPGQLAELSEMQAVSGNEPSEPSTPSADAYKNEASAKAVSSLSASKPKIDYQEIDRRMKEAVQAGRMTEEQVAQAWIRIKSKGSREDKADRKGDGMKLDYKSKADRSFNKAEAIRQANEKFEQSRNSEGG